MTDVVFDATLRQQLQSNLGRHDRRSHELEGRRHAAVSVIVMDSDAVLHGDDDTDVDPFFMRELPGAATGEVLSGRVAGTAGGASVMLTRRSARLKSHPNQWALPGGRIDDGETPLEAAMREVREEVGLQLTTDNLLGQLDDYPTRSGYVMTPFVFWLDDDQEPVAEPGEVASIHRISIRERMRADSQRYVQIEESDRPVVQIAIGQDLIHAPTGAIVLQFREVAYQGRSMRVDTLEQPVFAWR
jgi:8-oxo-dGTP pyrophosphatase MutT (NUDIX family)